MAGSWSNSSVPALSELSSDGVMQMQGHPEIDFSTASLPVCSSPHYIGSQ